MEALLSKALDAVGVAEVEVTDGSEVPLPVLTETLHLPPPTAAMKEARAKLSDIRAEGLADLKAQLKAVTDEIAKEQKIVDAGDFDLAEMLAKGTPKSKLQKMRIDAELASEIIDVKLNDAADIKAKIEMKKKELYRVETRLIGWLEKTEVQTRAYQISLITGADRLTPEKFARSYRLLNALEDFATEVLGADLAQRVIASITNNPIPPTLQECLLAQMTKRDRDLIETTEGAK